MSGARAGRASTELLDLAPERRDGHAEQHEQAQQTNRITSSGARKRR
jgi:hypothetical protein